MARVSREKWLDDGLEVLKKSGPETITPELLSVRLSMAKGAFFFHFGDREQFLTALLEHWIERSSGEGAILSADPLLEAAMRAWARSDPRAANAIVLVDRQRITALAAVYERKGLAPDRALRLARLEHAAFVGAQTVYGDLHSPEAREVDAELRALVAPLIPD